jgi:hypothetical protein
VCAVTLANSLYSTKRSLFLEPLMKVSELLRSRIVRGLLAALLPALMTLSGCVVGTGVQKPTIANQSGGQATQAQTVTAGQAATFTVTATGTAPLSFQWYVNGTVIAGAVSNSYTIAVTTSSDNGSVYTVEVSNAAGTTTSSPFVLTVNTPPAITLQPTSQTVTAGQAATFTVTATGTAPLTYQWDQGGTAISGATGSSYTIPTTAIGNSGSVYTVLVTNMAGTVTSTAATLTVAPLVTPTSLTLTPITPVAGQVGTAYALPLVAAGGTAPYTWSVQSGALPAGLSFAANTGTISGTPLTAGTSTFVIAVRDSGTPVQTASTTLSISIAAAPVTPGPGTTWYIRPDGGTRFSTDLPTGQCNGQYDASYASTGGTGVNQNCAFNDFRWLYDSQGYNDNAWVIAGGDTVIVRGCASGPNNVAPNCRIGWDSNTGPGAGYTWCYGVGGGGCQPPIPAGTASQHTRILGQNYAACVVPTPTTTGNTSQLFGGFGLYKTLDLSGAQYLDVECLELTSHVNCVEFGAPTSPISLPACSRSAGTSLTDYVDYGFVTTNTTHDVLLQDMWIHGMSNSGIRGPIGGTFTATRVNIGYNGSAGWSMDDGSSTQNVNGVLNLNYVTIEWNGCTQQYPITNAIPALYCFDDGYGGYGDGLGTQSPAVLQFTCNHCIARYNTQDGFDVGHVSNSAVSWTDSTGYGNEGGVFKSGMNTSYTLINDVSIGNCERMSAPFPGAPSTYNLYLGDLCRAAGDENSFGFDNTQTPLPSATIEFSTFIGYGATVIDASYAGSQTSCAGCTYLFRDNIVLGYSEASYDAGQAPGMFYGMTPTIQDHNLFYGTRYCPAVSADVSPDCQLDAGFIGEPLSPLSSESQMDNYNFSLAPGSAAIGAGVSIVGVTTDYNGNTRANPPSVGPLEYGSTTP